MAHGLDAGTAARPVGDRFPAVVSRLAYQAYLVLYAGFVALPILAGLDKFFHLLVDWDQYLAPLVTQTLPVSAHNFMLVVGVVEIVAGFLVVVHTLTIHQNILLICYH